MNNKGFTLVELLAVMVILLSISVVAVTNVTASLKRTEEAEKDSQKKMIINAAKIYFSMNTVDNVKISELINAKYIKDESLISSFDTTYYVIGCNNGTYPAVIGYDIKQNKDDKKCSWIS